jgi:hypothetical protein
VTVLLCDLVGSTEQAERLDPEDVRALLSTEGRLADAEQRLDDLLALGDHMPALISGFGVGLIEVAWLARDLDRGAYVGHLPENARGLPWISAARSVAAGDLEQAAAILAETGSPPAEAYTRLRTAEKAAAAGDREAATRHLEAAAAFYNQVRATYYLGRCRALEAQLGLSASRARDA